MPKKKEEPIIPQAKLMRVLQIIAVLKSGKWSIKSLAERVGIGERTIYRYLLMLEAVDFLVEKDFENRYFIMSNEDDPGQKEFTTEEMKLVKKLIQSEVDDNPLRAQLLRKLSLNSELDKVPRIILKARLGKLIEKTAEAIHRKKQIILKNYHSANSNEIGDRLVEAIDFGDNYTSIQALDLKDKQVKQFKIDRVGDVIVLDKPFAHPELHLMKKADIFGITGGTPVWITLHMKMRAQLLLREEHPLSINYIEKLESGDWQFHGPVHGFEAAGRFVMGLWDEITIVGPGEFVEYVRTKMKL